jgi:hypothetical protein
MSCCIAPRTSILDLSRISDMAYKKFVVKLSGEERGRLSELISKGKAKAKTILKARILLKVDQGEADHLLLAGLTGALSSTFG